MNKDHINQWEEYHEGRKATQRLDYQKDDGTHSGKMCRHPVHKCRHQMSVTKIKNLKKISVGTSIDTKCQ